MKKAIASSYIVSNCILEMPCNQCCVCSWACHRKLKTIKHLTKCIEIWLAIAIVLKLVSIGHIKIHSSVSAAKKTKDARHTSVLFTGTVKLPNSAFCISKTTKLISTKFIYFLPYVNTTSQIKIAKNHFSISRDIYS